MKCLDVLIHIINFQKEKALKIKNKQRLFNCLFYVCFDIF